MSTLEKEETDETGRGTVAREALLRLGLIADEMVECLIDTVFMGALVLPQSLVTRLAPPVRGVRGLRDG